MTYATICMINNEINCSYALVENLHTSSGTLTERTNFSKNGLALSNFES